MRKLHIAGQIKADGWELFSIDPYLGADHVGDAKDLSRFGDGTFGVIYASHVLEHFKYTDIPLTLKEWYRVLGSEGKLYLSVPDQDVLSRLFLDKEKFNLQERGFLIKMMHGGHMDEHDVHQISFDRDTVLC